MNRIQITGVDGSNPLGFLAGLGILRIAPGGRLGFASDGTFKGFVDGVSGGASNLVELIMADCEAAADDNAAWRFTYTKAPTKKQGPKEVADLKAPPGDFRHFLAKSVEAWRKGYGEQAQYAAAFGTDVAVDGKGNTKPTAFHFTAANQTFLSAIEGIRSSLTREWIKRSLFEGNAEERGSNMRWDPNAERNWALMAGNPNENGTSVNAPLEWLAFRGLPLLPTFPRGKRIVTTCVTGRREKMTFTWPLWSVPATLATVRSLLQIDWLETNREFSARGVFAICCSAIRRSSQGFGNFGPSSVTC